MTITDLKQIISQRRGKLQYLQQEHERVSNLLTTSKTDRENAEEARRIIQHVASETQKQLEYHVSEIVTLALEAVFPDPYALKLEFKLKRGQSEAYIQFIRGDMVLENPTMESGGGVVDVASFALRVSLWSLAHPRSRDTLILDEPLRFLSTDLQAKASTMIHDLSRRLRLQFILVTHERALLEHADRVFSVGMKKGVSVVAISGAEG